MTQFGRLPMQRMTTEERDRLSLYLRDNDLQDWLIWRLMEEGFLRISEVLSLRAGDVLPDGRIVCHRKKGSKANVLPVRDSEVWSALLCLLKIRPHKADVLFNRPRRTFDWRLKQAGEKCGIPVEKCHAHTAKHNACQEALDETGHNVLAVKELAGHESISSTLIYLNMTTADALKLREGNSNG